MCEFPLCMNHEKKKKQWWLWDPDKGLLTVDARNVTLGKLLKQMSDATLIASAALPSQISN